MSNVHDLRRRKVETIQEIVDEIHRQFEEALSSDKKAHSARVYAGQLLNGLRERFKKGEMSPAVSWWDWYEENFVRSRQDAEKVMALATSPDPESAAEEEKRKAREGMRRSRAANVSGRDEEEDQPKDVYRELAEAKNELFNHRIEYVRQQNDPVGHLLRLVEKLDAQQRQRFLAEIRRRYDKD